MNYSNWKIEECPTDKLKMFTDAGYPALLAALLSVRGLGSVQEAKSFLDGGAELLCDPLLMKDMDRAAARIRRALSMRRKIRNGQYARADAVTDNYARGLHEGKFGFTFYIRHLPDLRQ